MIMHVWHEDHSLLRHFMNPDQGMYSHRWIGLPRLIAYEGCTSICPWQTVRLQSAERTHIERELLEVREAVYSK